MDKHSSEARVILALEAIKNDENLSLRAAAKIYQVSRTTLLRRRNGVTARRDSLANSRKLTNLEEEAIVQYVIELASRSFPPRLCSVKDMANQLLRACDAPPIGTRWAHNFVRR